MSAIGHLAFTTVVETNYPDLLADLAKIRKILRGYAESRSTSLNKLAVMEICDLNNQTEPNWRLLEFIRKARQRQKTKNYEQETKSRIRKILRRIFTTTNIRSNSEDLKTLVPSFLEPFLHLMPRAQGSRVEIKNGYWVKNKGVFNLSEKAGLVLQAVLEVSEELGTDNLEELLSNHRKINFNIKRSAHSSAQLSCLRYFYKIKLRAELKGLILMKPRNLVLKTEDFPPKLREQIEVFLDCADKPVSPLLQSSALSQQVKLNVISQLTAKNYVRIIAGFLRISEIKDPANFGIENFLRTELVEKKLSNSKLVLLPANHLLDRIREAERVKETGHKRTGFDSDRFRILLNAVKAVGGFNGIFEFHAELDRAYICNTDHFSKQTIKQRKKEIFDRAWLDTEIERLELKFDEIIRKKSFKLIARAGNEIVMRENLGLCQFLVMLATLRYMGYRQQCLRNCRVGKNIVFKSNGIILLRWEANETKNKKAISVFLDPQKFESHQKLHKILTDYYHHIYPYLCSRAAGDLDKQFYLCPVRDQFRRIKSGEARDCFQLFQRWALNYLEFGNRFKDGAVRLHPHFLRGLCADWLIVDLQVSISKAAEFLGDTEATLRAEYIDQNRVCRADAALEEANFNLTRERATASVNLQIIDLVKLMAEKEVFLCDTAGKLEKSQAENDLLKRQIRNLEKAAAA